MPVVAAVGMAHVALAPTQATVADLQVAVAANMRHARRVRVHPRVRAAIVQPAAVWVMAWAMAPPAALVAIVLRVHPKASPTRCALA